MGIKIHLIIKYDFRFPYTTDQSSDDIYDRESSTKPGNPEKSGIAELPDQELEIIKYISEKKKYITEIIAGLLEVGDRGVRGIFADFAEKKKS